MKARAGGILSHDPGVGIANLLDGMGGETDEVGIPAPGVSVGVRHAVAELDERVLDVTRLLLVVQIFGKLRIREVASKPGIPPEEKGHEDDQPSGREEKNLLRPRHGTFWLGVYSDRCGFDLVRHAWFLGLVRRRQNAGILRFSPDESARS